MLLFFVSVYNMFYCFYYLIVFLRHLGMCADTEQLKMSQKWPDLLFALPLCLCSFSDLSVYLSVSRRKEIRRRTPFGHLILQMTPVSLLSLSSSPATLCLPLWQFCLFVCVKKHSLIINQSCVDSHNKGWMSKGTDGLTGYNISTSCQIWWWQPFCDRKKEHWRQAVWSCLFLYWGELSVHGVPHPQAS